MGGALIDLGEVPRDESRRPAVAVASPSPPWRLLLSVLSVLLVVSPAGSVARAEPAPPVVVPALIGDAMRVTEDRLFVISPGRPAGPRTIRAYALPDVTLLSEHTVTVTGDVLSVDVAGDLLLLTVQDEVTVSFGTIALHAGRDRPLWQRPALLQGVSAAEGLALVREDGDRFGEADWRGVDLQTGAVRWTVHQSDGDDVAVSSYDDDFPQWLYVLTAGGRLEARDTRTGRVAAAVRVPERRERTAIWPAGPLVLVGTSGAGTTGYDVTAGLAARWHTGMNPSWYRGPARCGEFLCAYRPQRGMLVIDPATGRERWSSERWDFADRVGRYLLTVVPDTAEPVLHVLDPATGAVLGDAGRWQSAGPGPEPDTAWVLRPAAVEDRTWYGVLDLRRAEVRVLGAAGRVAGDCHFAAGALVCRRIDASVGVWRVR